MVIISAGTVLLVAGAAGLGLARGPLSGVDNTEARPLFRRIPLDTNPSASSSESPTLTSASPANASPANASPHDASLASLRPSSDASGPPSIDDVPATFPRTGPATWRYAMDQGAVLGSAGPLRRFRVAVESNVPVDAAAFAAKVDQVLGDPRSWIGGGLRLQRVPGLAAADFTIQLATERTSRTICAAGHVDTGGFTSCRTPGHVVINLDRWYLSVPAYVSAHIPLDTYRDYVINHETGHELGHGHELCPGAGRPAPVMEQQTLGLHGCTANAWPYLAGRRYAGPAGSY